MPITKSAKKGIRQSKRRKIFNDHRKDAMKDYIRKIIKLSKTDKDQASSLLSSAYQAIDKAAKYGIIKRKNAARKKSRVARLIK